MQDGFILAADLLPKPFRARAETLSAEKKHAAEEFRLRIGFPAAIRFPDGESTISEEPVTKQMLQEVLERASRASVHAVTEQLRQGFLTAPGGIRVGVCGTAVMQEEIRTIRDVSSLCIRIPRQLPAAGKEIMPQLCAGGSVLILSPPGGGKTTLLRELVRNVSDGGARVCVADERGEIAGMYCGKPQFDIGRCTDVLCAAPKAEAAMLLLRAMGPDVVAMDEISAPKDICAVEQLIGCGVRVFATAHADDFGDFLNKQPAMRDLAERGAFQTVVCICSRSPRRYEVMRL